MSATPDVRDRAPTPSLLLSVLLTGLVALGALSTDMYLPALPIMAAELGSTAAAMQITLSVFMVGLGVGQLGYGPLSDRFGRRPVILAGLALYGLGSLACLLAPGTESLIAARFLQGIGAACGPTLARAVIRDLYERDAAASMLAHIASAMAVVPALAPILGGWFAVGLGWRAIFGFMSVYAVILWLALRWWLPETNPYRGETALDPISMLKTYGGLLRDRPFVAYLLINSLSFAALFAFISGASFVFIDALGVAAEDFGYFFAIMVAGYFIGSQISGRFSRKWGTDRMIDLGVNLAAIAGVSMVAVTIFDLMPLVTIITTQLGVSISAGLIFPNAAAAAVAPYARRAGAASALLGFFQVGAAAISGAVVGRLYDGTAIPMAVVIAGCAVAAWIAARRRPRDTSTG